MTKNSSRGEFNSFVGGLVTEASALNFPEKAAKDIDNFELNRDGTLNRRLGFDLEEGYNLFPTTITVSELNSGFTSSYVWEDPGNQAGLKFLVVQFGRSLLFFNSEEENISVDGFVSEVSLPSLTNRLNKSSFAAVDGRLIIATGDQSVYLVTFNAVNRTFTLSSFRLTTRDIWGVSVSQTDIDPNARPTSGDNHIYNLYNQGWAIPRNSSTSSFPIQDQADRVRTAFGYYPSDADSVWQAMITVPNGSNTLEVFDTTTYRSNLNESSGVSRGFFILDLLNRGTSRSQAIVQNKAQFPPATLATFTALADTTVQGASVVCEYAGRVFSAGFGPTANGDVRSPDLSSYVAFSRLVRNSTDLGKCYQEGDPTSRESNDVVDTDGGLIRISGATNIRRMIVQGKNLIIIADNGVWSVEGGSDFGFSASNYKVDKVSSFGGINSDSVISDGSRTYYWAEDSIYSILRNEFGDLVYESLSEQRIASFYNSIDITQKREAKGFYDKISKKLRWIYQDSSKFSAISEVKELVFDLALSAFYKNTVKNLNNTAIVDLFLGPTYSVEFEETQVICDTDDVFSVEEPVVILNNAFNAELQSVKYLCVVKDGPTIYIGFGWYKDTSFKDWKQIDGQGVDAKAFLETGAITAGDSSVHKQTPLLVVHMKRTEKKMDEDYEPFIKSGCLVRTAWDFATSSNSKKISPFFQVYRYRRAFFSEPGEYDNGFEIVTTRNKLRGRGRALSIRMETEVEKDCKIIGWNLSLNGNSIA